MRLLQYGRDIRGGAPHTPSLPGFITALVQASATTTTLMGALVYVVRLKSRLQPIASGRHGTNHRIFLSSIILADKYLHGNALTNKYWATLNAIRSERQGSGFSLREVNLMEIQLLDLLRWDLRITLDDLCTVSEPFIAPIRARIQRLKTRDVLLLSAYPWILSRYSISKCSDGRSLAVLCCQAVRLTLKTLFQRGTYRWRTLFIRVMGRN